ncbi:hypothetical protein [Sphingopyxis sp. 22461]|uniref:hypothetical protein n=1 Tax=Sphingopyxis sp. 22461 TaxID=3453923 RepID=UPI003F86DBFA
MTGGFGQMMRVLESLPADAPIADRFHATLEASDAFMAECDRIQMQHRADMVARWGLPDDHFTLGPANPTLPTIKDSM